MKKMHKQHCLDPIYVFQFPICDDNESRLTKRYLNCI